MISSIVLFFKRESCGAGPTLDAASGVETEAAKPLAAAGAFVVALSFSVEEDAGVVPLAACAVFGLSRLDAGAGVVIPGAEVVVDAVVLLGSCGLLNREDF